MPIPIDNRMIRFSQGVYAWMLQAYPKRHRAEYGPEMLQLFRDQCREAWSEGQTWGIVRLWLRTLPDLVKTSLVERLAALSERKHMANQLMATNLRVTFFKVFVPVFVLILGMAILITFLLPESYASTSRIIVNADLNATTNASAGDYNPYRLQTTMRTMISRAVLEPVIQELNLNTKWGKKYNASQPFTTEQTLQILQNTLTLRALPDQIIWENKMKANQPITEEEMRKMSTLKPDLTKSLVAITVYSGDRVEAAQIANAVARSYQQYALRNEQAKGTLPPSVLIVDTAMPGNAPVKPNKPLNICVGIILGIFSATFLGGMVVLGIWMLRKRGNRLAVAG